MPSALLTKSSNAAWFLVNNVNNDGYCNDYAPPHTIVCRAWATGLS